MPPLFLVSRVRFCVFETGGDILKNIVDLTDSFNMRSSKVTPKKMLPKNRNTNPLFYGFVPDKALNRAVCFLAMMALSFSHVILQTSSCVLLAITKKTWLLYYLSIDMALFFLYKVVQRDFCHYINLEGPIRYIAALVMRASGKVLQNFTLLIHMRNPCECGGFLFLSSLLISVVRR